ncbi:hypothetical protein ACF0H5_002107 [Mactra antiquata]
MAAELFSVLALFLFLPLAKQDSIHDARNNVLQAIEGIVDFFDADYQNLNIDGLYGLRVLEGHLEAILKQYQAGDLNHVTVETIEEIKKLKERTSRSGELALSHVKKNGAAYYKKMSYVVSAPWSIFYPQRRVVNVSMAWTSEQYVYAKKHVTLDEKQSDKCMSELIGSHKTNGKPCDISRKCVEIMSSPGLLGYGNTHQILWTMLAEKAGCTDKLQSQLFEIRHIDLQTLRLEMCSNNFIQLVEMLNKMPNGVIIPSVQDLYLEQLFICPSLGFYEFLDIVFLPQVLSWQSKIGCFGKLKKVPKGVKLDRALTGDFEEDYLDDEVKKVAGSKPKGPIKFKKNAYEDVDDIAEIRKKYDRDIERLRQQKDIFENNNFFGETKNKWDMPPNPGRKLLVERAMSGGCLAHKTAVASGALVMYLRYLLADDADVLFSSKRNLQSVTPEDKTGGQGDFSEDAKHDFQQDAVKNTSTDEGLEADEQFQNDTDNNENPSKRLQVAAPRFLINDYKLKPHDNNQLAMNSNNNVEPSKDDENYDYKYDDDNNVNDDDEEKDDYDDDDDYDEEENNDNNGNLPRLHDRPGGKMVRNMNNYYNGADDVDGKRLHDNINPDDDNDDDYNTDDGYNDGYDDNDRENVHPHINARNIGHGKSRDYDKEVYEDDKGIKAVKDYDDDEEGDDYEYDDDNDEMEKRRQDELKNEFILAKTVDNTVKNVDKHIKTGSAITDEKVLSNSTYFILIASLICILILYRMIKRRRIRLKIGHKYFHV